MEIVTHSHLKEFMSLHGSQKMYFVTKNAERTYEEMDVSGEVFLVFGKETWGLPPALLANNQEQCFRIPMRDEVRSLNLSSAAAVVIYDVLRRRRFSGLSLSGGGVSPINS